MRERVVQIMSHVLNVPVASLDETASPDTIATWDSLNHMNLVLALEQEFGVQFRDEEILQLLSVTAIADAVAGRVAAGEP